MLLTEFNSQNGWGTSRSFLSGWITDSSSKHWIFSGLLNLFIIELDFLFIDKFELEEKDFFIFSVLLERLMPFSLWLLFFDLHCSFAKGSLFNLNYCINLHLFLKWISFSLHIFLEKMMNLLKSFKYEDWEIKFLEWCWR